MEWNSWPLGNARIVGRLALVEAMHEYHFLTVCSYFNADADQLFHEQNLRLRIYGLLFSGTSIAGQSRCERVDSPQKACYSIGYLCPC